MALAGTARRGVYADSIALMRVTEAVRRLPGVSDAALLMATEANRALLAGAGLWPAAADGAGADDLVMAVRAETVEAAQAALVQAEALLAARRPDDAAASAPRPRSLTSAARHAGEASLAVISVPGPHAAAEAHQALAAGLDVFIFSDGVSVEDEVALKRRAAARGLLVMGPECGTSILGGLGVGFANRVRAGAIGLVGASGTGLQEVTCLIHALGGGVSHAIGTGGRDLQEAVGGLTTLAALERLAADETTRVIVLVSKPAADAVAERVLGAAAALGKPVVACLLGWPGTTPAGVHAAATLEDAARLAVQATGAKPAKLPPPRGRAGRVNGRVVGLFTGGTLCAEGQALVGEAGGRFVDFGAEEYTRGRPHPMIDPALRSAAIAEAGDDPGAGVVLLDVVLGDCAHPDPAGVASAAIAEARARAGRAGRPLAFVAHVVGTDLDPQGLAGQTAALRRAGAIVCASNRSAALAARALVLGRRA